MRGETESARSGKEGMVKYKRLREGKTKGVGEEEATRLKHNKSVKRQGRKE